MSFRWIAFTVAALVSASASAELVEKKLAYEIDGKPFEGVLVYDNSVLAKRPGVLFATDWSGVSANAIEIARNIAGKEFVVFVADLFGAGYAPKDAKERGTAITTIHKDLATTRARGDKGLEVMLAEGQKLGILDPNRTAGIGFCFGGGVLLETARQGRNFKVLTVFHVTNPQPVDPAGPSNVKGSVLVLHGADDPITPRAKIAALEEELDRAGVRWQTVMFSGAVHAYTDKTAPVPGASAKATRFDAYVSKRSYELMREFFADNL